MPEVSKGRALTAAGVAAVLVVGGIWWGVSSGESAPEASSVTCTDDGLTDLLDERDGPGERHRADIPTAPRAAASEPRESGTSSSRSRPVDFQWASATDGLGYRLDPSTGTLSYASGPDDEPLWTTRISDVPLEDVGHEVAGFPGSRDLIAVSARRGDDGAPLLAVLDTDGTVQLACAAEEAAAEHAERRHLLHASSLTPDGSMLLLSDTDDDESWWTAGHSTDGGQHVWSAPGLLGTSDDHRAYVVDGLSIGAFDLESGDEEWAREVDWNFDDATSELDIEDVPEDWQLAAVDDELYVYPSGATRLVVLDVRRGELEMDIIPGDTDAGRLRLTQLDADGTVMLDFGGDVAVRKARNWFWLHRSTEWMSAPTLIAREDGEATLAVFRTNNLDSTMPLSVHTVSGNRLITLPYRSRDHSYAVADSAVYVLSETESTVTGYDLESTAQLWTVEIPADLETTGPGLRAAPGGFDIVVDDGTLLRYRDNES